MSCFFFMFSEFRWEVIVRFVDISRIIDHHCLNFLSINKDMFWHTFVPFMFSVSTLLNVVYNIYWNSFHWSVVYCKKNVSFFNCHYYPLKVHGRFHLCHNNVLTENINGTNVCQNISLLMERKFKQWWSIILLISTFTIEQYISPFKHGCHWHLNTLINYKVDLYNDFSNLSIHSFHMLQ
jgi:hypothetical protein